MKKGIALLSLIGWSAFLVLQHITMVHALHAKGHTECTSSHANHHANKANTDADCCTKFHPEDKQDETCTTHGTDGDKDCCGGQGCARICCSFVSAVLLIVPAQSEPKMHFITTHTSLYPHHHLPSPFIGTDTPPPNA